MLFEYSVSSYWIQDKNFLLEQAEKSLHEP